MIRTVCSSIGGTSQLRINISLGIWACLVPSIAAQDVLPVIPVEGQPLDANVRRLMQALDLLGNPLANDARTSLDAAARDRDHSRLQTLLDPHVLFVVGINPESRVKVLRGPASARLQQ